MKKVFSVALILILLVTSFSGVSATETKDEYIFHTNQQYGYTYTNYTDQSGRIIGSYNKKDNVQIGVGSLYTRTTKENGFAYTKSLLSDLGMSERSINALSSESLDMYSNAEQINITTTYQKTDMIGNITIVDEQTALEEASAINLGRVAPLPEDFGSGEGSAPDYYNDTTTNSYMKITLTVSVLGNGQFHYSVDAEWLTPPSKSERNYDSLSICVKNNSIISGTQFGRILYHHVSGPVSDDPTITPISYNYNSTNLEQITNGEWIAVGFVYKLPEDDDIAGIYLDNFIDFSAHLEFKGQVNNPTEASYFYVTATYEHMTSSVFAQYIKPNLEITLSGDNSYANMNTIFNTVYIKVSPSLPIHHVP